jgi:hypothetical protein
MAEVQCKTHGPRKATFVCSHAVDTLFDRQPRGFFWTDAEADEPCGWCTECNDRYIAAGEEWSDEAEAKLDAKLLCIECFESLIRLNGFH